MIEEPPPASKPASTARKPVPERFQVSPATLRFDRFMTVAIQAGGIGIILAVFAIFFFIGWEVIPLFRKAHVAEAGEISLPADLHAAQALGVDDWGQLPFVYTGGPDLAFVDRAKTGEAAVTRIPLGLPEGTQVTAVTYNQRRQRLVLGTAAGQIAVADIKYSAIGGTGETARAVTTEVEFSTPLTPIGTAGAPIRSVAFGDGGNRKIIAVLQEEAGELRLHATTFAQKRGLMGSGKVTKEADFDLTSSLTGRPQRLITSGNGESLLVSQENGEIAYFFLQGKQIELRQKFAPFADSKDPHVSSMDYLFGDVSIVLTNPAGENRVYSLYRPSKDENRRLFGHTKTFPKLKGGATYYASSLRNKAFLLGSGNSASIRYSTTENVRWHDELPFTVKTAVFDPKYESMVFLTADGQLKFYALHDPHPEAGWKAFFGKIWYEGASAPAYEWQSTSGSDDFEPKLSLTPLIVGTLKGTFYALFFAVPIALLSAVYVSNFMQPNFKKVVKPTMEIMASLPSVVLGFLAALWLAPVIEKRVPSVLLICVGLPVVAVLFGWLWGKLPITLRSRVRPGREFLMLAPIVLVSAFLLWELGPVLERMLFVVRDPVTGTATADFRLWWPHATGASFDQRNSLVVGFMMGFAVIPIIFTISEDSLSNVPGSITAASAALGASRWQTVRHVVLPIASAGIFSALMIGLGRAVGETMIVVMATGNTPIMDFNIFSGMRTLSANVAVELPEAAVASTHYRTLFLGALALFLMTFALNTVAELLRQHLREKFKLV